MKQWQEAEQASALYGGQGNFIAQVWGLNDSLWLHNVIHITYMTLNHHKTDGVLFQI